MNKILLKIIENELERFEDQSFLVPSIKIAMIDVSDSVDDTIDAISIIANTSSEINGFNDNIDIIISLIKGSVSSKSTPLVKKGTSPKKTPVKKSSKKIDVSTSVDDTVEKKDDTSTKTTPEKKVDIKPKEEPEIEKTIDLDESGVPDDDDFFS
jgi:hypothetical protein